MCRWIAYNGAPVYMDTLVTKPTYSLMQQSINARMHYGRDGTLLPTNGDGFGVGWYDGKPEPGLFKVADPAWSNENIRELCAQVQARIFMAHIRAASTGGSHRSNAHPFKYKNWLFQHNGYVLEFEKMRRDLQFDIDPDLYPLLKGTTDSETFFLLALTYGLEREPKKAIERMINHVEEACLDKGIAIGLTLSCALSDGKTLYTVRYARGGASNSQYYSTSANCMRLHGDDSSMLLPPDSVVVVSEPLDQVQEEWTEMPDGSFAIIRDGQVTIEQLSV